jgi:asparagine synthase (glutamine-hydrolysing)
MAAADETVVRAMNDRLRHRGPDDEGMFISRHAVLANRRLSIIDLVDGSQPISNELGTIHVVYNGEIYNYRELRRDLLEKGHRFRSQSDTEVIVHLYEEYGEACVEKLNGMFAFAIWDEASERLMLARDPLGQKPLYYATLGDDFVFASEVKAILEHPRILPKLNTEALHHFLSLRCVPGTATLFQGVNKVAAGHTLVWDTHGVVLRRYWDLTYVPKLTVPEAEIVSQLAQMLESTVASHMVSDVPLGAFLSGGIDSSLVVAMMSRATRQRPKTFSIGVREPTFNELPYARMVAEQYATEHYEGVVEPDIVATIPEMIYYMEEPVDPFGLGVYRAAQLASQHVKVVLGGDGGDEVFAGYDRYLGNHLVDMYCAIPAVVRRRFLEPLIQRLPDNYQYNNRVQKLRWLVAMSSKEGDRRYAESASYLRFTHERKRDLYTDALWRTLGANHSEEELVRLFDAPNAQSELDKMLHADVKTRLADHDLMVVDRMTMAHSIEGRSVFVDRQLVEFVAAIPARLKIHRGTLKYVERRVAQRLLPGTLVKRKKQGFGFPLAAWFRRELRSVTARLLGQGSLAAAGYFRPSAMLSMLDEHTSGNVDHNYRLWLLLNAELWHRIFIEGESRDDLQGLLQDAMATRSPALV